MNYIIYILSQRLRRIFENEVSNEYIKPLSNKHASQSSIMCIALNVCICLHNLYLFAYELLSVMANVHEPPFRITGISS